MQANEPHVPPRRAPGQEVTDPAADERARAAGAGDAAVTEDLRVAGPPPGPGPVALDREEPAAASPEPAAASPEPAAHAPGGEHGPLERLLDAGAVESFRGRWRDLQAGFVDDPQETVRRAEALTAEIVDAVAAALAGRRRELEDRWHADQAAGDGSDTERLRQALRDYRDLVDRILAA